MDLEGDVELEWPPLSRMHVVVTSQDALTDIELLNSPDSIVCSGTWGSVVMADDEYDADDQPTPQVAYKIFRSTSARDMSIGMVRELALFALLLHKSRGTPIPGLILPRAVAFLPCPERPKVLCLTADPEVAKEVAAAPLIHGVMTMPQYEGSAHDLIPMGKDDIRVVIRDVLMGLATLHSAGIMHRDVKPGNILVRFNPTSAVLCDLGLGKLMECVARTGAAGAGVAGAGVAGAAFGGGGGGAAGACEIRVLDPMSWDIFTLCFRPPEVLLRSGRYGTAADMWALGMSILNMATGYYVRGKNEHEYLVDIFSLLGKPSRRDVPSYAHLYDHSRYPQRSRPHLNKHLGPLKDDPLAVDLILKLLDFEPDKRITASAALLHPFFLSPPQPPHPPLLPLCTTSPRWLRIRQGLEWSAPHHDLSRLAQLFEGLDFMPIVRLQLMSLRALYLGLELLFLMPPHLVREQLLAASLLLANTMTDTHIMNVNDAASCVGCEMDLVVPAACSILEHTHCHIARATLADVLGWTTITDPVKDVATSILLDLLARPLVLATKPWLRGLPAQNALVRIAHYIAAPGVVLLRPDRDMDFVCGILPLLTPSTPRYQFLREWITLSQQPLLQRTHHPSSLATSSLLASGSLATSSSRSSSSLASGSRSSLSTPSPSSGCIIE